MQIWYNCYTIEDGTGVNLDKTEISLSYSFKQSVMAQWVELVVEIVHISSDWC
jgi:hypothetical protein